MMNAVGASLASVALDGTLIAAIGVAFLAGLVSFASPCVVPLVPGYLAYVSGLAGADADTRARARPRIVVGAALFVAGFGAVFVILGVAVASAGSALAPHIDLILRVMGAVIIVLGLAFVGWVPFLSSDRRPHPRVPAGLWGAPLLGVAFGLGWTPCIGPTLGAVLTLALDQATVARGTVLSIAYTLGLGVPFIALAFAAERSRRILGWLRRHRLIIMRVGGGALVVLGILLVTGWWQDVTGMLQGWINGFWVPV